MDKDKGLVFSRLVKELLVADFVHDLELFDGFLFRGTDKDKLSLEPTHGW
jgi:hypothetical protein